MTTTPKRLNRSQINFIIDIILMVVMMLAAGVGLLIKYVLLPGFQCNIKYGRDVDLAFWGLDRHQWGTVHLIISLVLVALVALHIVLHWRQIKCLYKNLVRDHQKRIVLAFGLLLVCAVLAIGPLFIKPQVVASVGHGTGRLHESTIEHVSHISDRQSTRVESETEHQVHASLSNDIPIYGSMTIREVAAQYNVSAKELAQHVGVPETELDQRLGRLRRQYSFQMSEIRAYIENQQNSNQQ